MKLNKLLSLLACLFLLAAWKPIATTTPQYMDTNGDPYSGAVLKAYSSGTSSNILMATDTTGATTATDIALNSDGYPELSGNTIIPHLDEAYKLTLYPNQTAADSDTGAIWTIDNISIGTTFGSSTVEISTSDTLSLSEHCNAQIYATNTITLTLPSIATAANNCIMAIYNAGTGVVTLDGNASETVNGSTAYTVSAGGNGTLVAGSTTTTSDWMYNDSLGIPQTISEGDIFYASSGNRFTRLAIGATNEVLTVSGGEPTWGETAPIGYKYGLTLSNDGTDADHDIGITVGGATDSTGVSYINPPTALTKQIDASWATGDDAGGLSSSLTVAVDTWYHVFAITVAGVDDIGFDTSVTAANLVTDHSATAYRYVGSILTNGSSNIIAFTQTGNKFLWATPVNDVSTSSLGTTAVSYTLSTPLGFKVDAIMDASVDLAAGADVIISSLDSADQAASATHASMTNNSNGRQAATHMQVLTNTSSQIRARAGAASTALDAWVTGWEIGVWP